MTLISSRYEISNKYQLLTFNLISNFVFFIKYLMVILIVELGQFELEIEMKKK